MTRNMEENQRQRERTKKYIDLFGASKKILSQRLGFSDTTLYQWLHNQRELCDKTLKRVSEYFDQFNGVV